MQLKGGGGGEKFIDHAMLVDHFSTLLILSQPEGSSFVSEIEGSTQYSLTYPKAHLFGVYIKEWLFTVSSNPVCLKYTVT